MVQFYCRLTTKHTQKKKNSFDEVSFVTFNLSLYKFIMTFHRYIAKLS